MGKRWVGWLALAAGVAGLLWVAGAENRRMLEARGGAAELSGASGEMPASVAVTTILLGGFRGLAADWLWMRADTLQEEGKYFELAQLSAWIARLQPRSPGIWGYHAWNMAYNLSAMAGDADGKWRWVREGVRLLEEDGMRECPGEAGVYRELAWIFLHKMGGNDDAFAGEYRRRWGEEARARAAEGGGAVFGDAETVAEIGAAVPGVDWETVQAASLYWAWKGLRVARRRGDDLALRRMVYQSVFQMIRDGRRDLVPAAERLVRDTAARYPDNGALRGVLERLDGVAGE
ncbi:MAG: hypothetical protein IK066_06200 [Kiritimatiellae bacterium]|nr:hypothetical protein [Kiritimatiellia bacterium]